MNLSGSAIKFPFSVGQTGTVSTLDRSEDLIAQAIADIIETRRGERVMLPDYGIDDFVFETQDAGFAARLAYHLETQIRRYVPLVKSVRVETSTDVEGRAIVEIRYAEVGSVQAPRNMVYPIWRLRDVVT